METDLKHMDIGSRNARLRETLEGMGLFVTPIFREDKPDEIDFLHVSAAPPAYCFSQHQGGAKLPTSGAVTEPMAGSEIGENVRAAQSTLDNVVLFPTAS
jgi:hypothetical protein